jgi:TolA-binding protein
MDYFKKLKSQLGRIFGSDVNADTEDELLNALEGMDPIQSRIESAVDGAAESSSEELSRLKSELKNQISSLTEQLSSFETKFTELEQKLTDAEEVRSEEKADLLNKIDAQSKEIAKLKGVQTPAPDGIKIPETPKPDVDAKDEPITMSFEELRYGKTI